MKRLILGLSLVALLSMSVPVVAQSADGGNIGLEPTSPAGYSDETSSSSLADRMLHRARSFRGNPVPLGVLTGAILIVALAFGVYTVAAAYRHPDASKHS
jgi:hypothetical protein